MHFTRLPLTNHIPTHFPLGELPSNSPLPRELSSLSVTSQRIPTKLTPFGGNIHQTRPPLTEFCRCGRGTEWTGGWPSEVLGSSLPVTCRPYPGPHHPLHGTTRGPSHVQGQSASTVASSLSISLCLDHLLLRKYVFVNFRMLQCCVVFMVQGWNGGVEGQLVWAEMRGGGGVKWREDGSEVEVVLKFHKPGAYPLHALDGSLKFSLAQVGAFHSFF